MLPHTRERLANEAAAWRHLGLIDDALAETLAVRYCARGSAGLLLLRWLGFFGIFMVGSAVLGLVAALAGALSMFLSAVTLGAAGWAMWLVGAQLARDPRSRYPILGSALLTIGLIISYGALTLIYLGAGGERYEASFPWMMLLTAAAAVATAYRFRLRWPLLLGLLLFFHAVGSWHAYAGHGTYFLGIQDERLMAIVAAATAAFGVWHEAVAEEGAFRQHAGVGGLYVVFGLLYLNLSVWILSIWPGGLGWVLTFTAVGIAQIVAGAFLKDSRFTGFGIVFLGIDLYTRFFEHFWDRLSAGAFYLAAGLAAVALGAAFEWMASREGGAA